MPFHPKDKKAFIDIINMYEVYFAFLASLDQI
jgi:hypothetical protein